MLERHTLHIVLLFFFCFLSGATGTVGNGQELDDVLSGFDADPQELEAKNGELDDVFSGFNTPAPTEEEDLTEFGREAQAPVGDTGSKDLFERQKDIDYLDIPLERIHKCRNCSKWKNIY